MVASLPELMESGSANDIILTFPIISVPQVSVLDDSTLFAIGSVVPTNGHISRTQMVRHLVFLSISRISVFVIIS